MDIGKKIINYTLSKLFFPKVVTIDRPGIIYTKQDRKFGGLKTKRRLVFYFEDIFVNLQLETVKKLGKKKTAELWYKIGKDYGIRTMLLANTKKLPPFLLYPITRYIFSGLKSGGITSANKVEYDKKRFQFILRGSNNILCRKTGDGNIMAGVISGMLSILWGENFEGNLKCRNCPTDCKIIISKEKKVRYFPNIKELKPAQDYNKSNFPRILNNIKKHISFSDLFKFKKIQLDKFGKLNFMNKGIFPSEIGLLGLITKHYSSIKIVSLLNKTIIKESECLCNELTNCYESTKKRILFIESIFSAFGYGIINISIRNNDLNVIVENSPISKYDLMEGNYPILVLIINGFLNSIFNKAYKIKEFRIQPTLINIIYTKKN